MTQEKECEDCGCVDSAWYGRCRVHGRWTWLCWPCYVAYRDEMGCDERCRRIEGRRGGEHAALKRLKAADKRCEEPPTQVCVE